MSDENSYLAVGDLIEAGTMFGGLTTEQVLLQVIAESAGTVFLEATFFGVSLGTLGLDVAPDGSVAGGEFV